MSLKNRIINILACIRIYRAYESSLESSKWKPTLSLQNLNGSMSISPSEDMAEAKWLSLAISMPT